MSKATAETHEFILACDDILAEGDADLIRASATFYILDGWETSWPFPRMPRWLQPRYWPPDLVQRAQLAAELADAADTGQA